jgi:2,5-dihydroxypyridine 5,6-dioxygenase
VDRERQLAHPGWCQNLVAAGRLQRGERVLVVVDEPLLEQGSQLMAAVADAGGRPRLELWSGKPPVAVAAEVDLSLFLAQEPRADEAEARFRLLQAVTDHGGRQIFLGFVDGRLLSGELSQPQPDLSAAAEGVLAQLEGAKEVTVRGRGGTDLLLRIDGRPWRTDARPLEAGLMANFPGGEVFVAPHADGADGVLVADLTVPYTVAGLVDRPVTLRFERGRVTSIEGGRAAQMLRELVADAGRGADVVAELGIGLNPTVSPRGHVMLDEKAAETAHVAIGRNTGPYGGDNEAAIHVDCIFSKPEVRADGRRVELP